MEGIKQGFISRGPDRIAGRIKADKLFKPLGNSKGVAADLFQRNTAFHQRHPPLAQFLRGQARSAIKCGQRLIHNRNS